MKIEAAIIRAKNQPLSIESVELDEPREFEVLVRLVSSGICHTDFVARDQQYPVPHPVVCGHEGAGVVERVGSQVRKVAPGDHVVLTYMSCGTCRYCLQGQPAYCSEALPLNFYGARADGSTTLHQHGQPIHGAFFGQSSFATYALAHERNTIKVRKDVPLEILAPLGCGALTGAGTVLNALRPQAGASVAIFGMGGVGLSALLAAKLAGCFPLIAIDIQPGRLELAAHLGATHTIDARTVDALGAVREITGGGAEFTVEASGAPVALQQAVHGLCSGGVCGFVGAAPYGTPVQIDMNTLLRDRTVRGVIAGHCVPDVFIPKMIEYYLAGCFPFDQIIQFYPFADINRAIHDLEHGATIKAVLRL